MIHGRYVERTGSWTVPVPKSATTGKFTTSDQIEKQKKGKIKIEGQGMKHHENGGQGMEAEQILNLVRAEIRTTALLKDDGWLFEYAKTFTEEWLEEFKDLQVNANP